jgi:hypothetical protein
MAKDLAFIALEVAKFLRPAAEAPQKTTWAQQGQRVGSAANAVATVPATLHSATQNAVLFQAAKVVGVSYVSVKYAAACLRSCCGQRRRRG